MVRQVQDYHVEVCHSNVPRYGLWRPPGHFETCVTRHTTTLYINSDPNPSCRFPVLYRETITCSHQMSIEPTELKISNTIIKASA